MTETIGRYDSLGSEAKRGLRVIVWEACGGVCALCGMTMRRDAAQTDPARFALCHVRPAAAWGPTSERGGYVSGNVFGGCGRCNDDTKDRDLTPFAPMLNAPAWDSATLRAAGRAAGTGRNADSDHRASARFARLAASGLGQPF